MGRGYPNLELIEYKFKERIRKEQQDIFSKYYPQTFVEVFPQTWASTALGFPGVGGSAMTRAYTTVISMILTNRSSITTNTIESSPEYHGVYFDGRFAYLIIGQPTEKFFEDLKERNMASVMGAERYCDDSGTILYMV